MKLNSKLKELIVYGFGYGISKFSGFIFLPILVRVLNVDEFGKLDIVTTVISILAALSLLSIDSAFQRYYYKFERQALLGSVLCCSLISSLAFSVLFLFSFHFFGAINQLMSEDNALITSILVVVINLNSIFLVLLRYEKKIYHFVGLIIGQVLIFYLLAIYFLYYKSRSLEFYFIAQLISFTLSLIFAVFYIKPKVLFDFSIVSRLYHFSIPLYPTRVIGICNLYISRYFVAGMSVFYLGIYSAGVKVASVAQILYMACNFVWYPHLYKLIEERDRDKIRRDANYAMDVVLVSFFFIMFVLYFVADYILTKDYSQAKEIIPYLVLVTITQVLKDIVDIGPKAIEKTKYSSYVSFGTLFISVAVYSTPIGDDLLALVSVMTFLNILSLIINMIISERLYKVGLSISKLLIYVLIMALACVIIKL